MDNASNYLVVGCVIQKRSKNIFNLLCCWYYTVRCAQRPLSMSSRVTLPVFFFFYFSLETASRWIGSLQFSAPDKTTILVSKLSFYVSFPPFNTYVLSIFTALGLSHTFKITNPIFLKYEISLGQNNFLI